MPSVRLGLGLLSIGRQWGVNHVPPPSEEESMTLIGSAFANGIKFFDTAPAYARSEEILGRALASSFIPKDETIIATKMGEHWDYEANVSRVGHGFDDLMKSVDRSLELLGKIDLLQLHKADVSNIVSPNVLKAFDRAASMGIGEFGASVSDLETAAIACTSGRFHYLQFPFNLNNRSLEAVFELLAEHNMKAIVNRPFAMGALVNSGVQSSSALFRGILDAGFSGVILTGTSSIPHLRANIAAFQNAIS